MDPGRRGDAGVVLGSCPRCRGDAVGPGCAVSGGSGRCCTFDRDRPAADRRNHAENPELARAGAPVRCAAPPHGSRRTRPTRERPSGEAPPGTRSCPNSAGDRPHHTHPGPRTRSWRERRNAPTGAWCSLTPLPSAPRMGHSQSQCTYRCVVLPDLTHPPNKRGTVKSQCTYRCVVLLHHLRPRDRGVSMHLQVRGAP